MVKIEYKHPAKKPLEKVHGQNITYVYMIYYDQKNLIFFNSQRAPIFPEQEVEEEEEACTP